MAASHSSDDLPSNPLADHLSALCERAPPGRLLFLHEPRSITTTWLAGLRRNTQSSIEPHALELSFDFSALRSRYQLCIACIELTTLQSGGALECLARIKHQFCNHIELVVQIPGRNEDARPGLDKTLFSLGFQHTSSLALPGGNLECYAYELQRYNKKRSWNSPEHWANPENFDKFRW